MRYLLATLFVFAAACDSADPEPADTTDPTINTVGLSGAVVAPDTALYAMRDTLRFEPARLFTLSAGAAPTYEVEATGQLGAALVQSVVEVVPLGEAGGEVVVRARVGDEQAEARVAVRSTIAWCAPPPAGAADYFGLPDGTFRYEAKRGYSSNVYPEGAEAETIATEPAGAVAARSNVYPEGAEAETLEGRAEWVVSSTCRLGERTVHVAETFEGVRSSSYLQTHNGDTLEHRNPDPVDVVLQTTTSFASGEHLPVTIGSFWELRSNGTEAAIDRFRTGGEGETTVSEQLRIDKYGGTDVSVTLRRNAPPAAFELKAWSRAPSLYQDERWTTTLRRVE
jgi:hypothetical protein